MLTLNSQSSSCPASWVLGLKVCATPAQLSSIASMWWFRTWVRVFPPSQSGTPGKLHRVRFVDALMTAVPTFTLFHSFWFWHPLPWECTWKQTSTHSQSTTMSERHFRRTWHLCVSPAQWREQMKVREPALELGPLMEMNISFSSLPAESGSN